MLSRSGDRPTLGLSCRSLVARRTASLASSGHLARIVANRQSLNARSSANLSIGVGCFLTELEDENIRTGTKNVAVAFKCFRQAQTSRFTEHLLSITSIETYESVFGRIGPPISLSGGRL